MMARPPRLLSRALRSDRRGVAGIEFALILPLLVLLFFGSVTLFHYYRTALTLDRATSTVTDLMSREERITAQFMTQQVEASLNGLVPHRPQALAYRVTSLLRENDRFTTDWTYPVTPGPHFEDRPPPSDALPVVANGDSVLLMETVLEQSALVDVIGVPTITHRVTAAVRPRSVRFIEGP